MLSRNKARLKKHLKIRTKISGTHEIPRLSVFKSDRHFEAQLIDDVKGHTIIGVSSKNMEIKYAGNIAASILVGTKIGKLIKDKKIEKIVFDRSGYIYHGRIKAFADAVRKEGIKF